MTPARCRRGQARRPEGRPLKSLEDIYAITPRRRARARGAHCPPNDLREKYAERSSQINAVKESFNLTIMLAASLRRRRLFAPRPKTCMRAAVASIIFLFSSA